MNYQYTLNEPLFVRLYTPDKQTGFKYQEMEGGVYFQGWNKDYNHILFLLDGSMYISCNEFSKRLVDKDQFGLIPISADVICETISDCRMLIYSFSKMLGFYDKKYMQSLIEVRDSELYDFTFLTINDPLKQFINLQLLYFDTGMDNPILHELKENEFFVMLRSFYKKIEVALFLYPLIGESNDFRMKVLKNFHKMVSANIKDIASLFDMEPKTFSRQFKEEFGLSPYQWLLNEKAKHISFSLAESNESLESIRKEFGFKFPSHFTRFCKEQFNCTPLQLRKRLKQEKMVM